MKIENEVVAEEWQVVPLKGNVRILSGFPFASEGFNESVGTPLIRIRNLLTGLTDTLFNGSYNEEFLVRKGDILIGMDGDFHLVKWKGRDALLNQRIMKIAGVESSDIDLGYAYYLLQPFLLNVHARTSATTVKHLSTKSLHSAYFKIPPLPEQRKIAEILSTLDEKMAVMDEQLAQTQELKKGLMQRLLTKGIGHTQFKDSPLGEIPASWEVACVDEVADIKTGAKDTQNKEEFGEYPFFVRSQNIERISSYSFAGEAVLTAGDGVGVGKVFHYVNGKFDYHQRVYNVHNFAPKMYGLFFFEFFKENFMHRVRKYNAKGSVDSVRREMISKMPVPIPPLPEQRQIAEILTTVDEKIGVLQDKKAQYQTLKRGLMQQLLTGQRRVRVLALETAALV